MVRKATAVWNGSGKEGKGHLTTQSSVLSKTQYSFNSRFEEGGIDSGCSCGMFHHETEF